MKGGDRDRAGALRLVLSELQKDAKEGTGDEQAVLRRERKRRRDAEEAFRGVRDGDILPLHVIRERIRVPGAQLIGADLIANGTRYRLRFMRGPNVLWVDVDARTGQVLGRAGF